MAAHQTVPELLGHRKSPAPITPQHGVATLFGYGIRVQVERGHLIVEDGVGRDRRKARFARVGHGLRRVVVIGSDGFVSLAALRWLADQDASFVMLERNGSVLATTGPVNSSDARLRRAQSLAHHNGLALHIARELISQKLLGQENVVRRKMHRSVTADEIAALRDGLKNAKSIDVIRLLESQAAKAYWLAWRALPIRFPEHDLARVPDHWRIFGNRRSPLTGSARLAANPPNAMLNYLYAILEAECRLALAAMGLDPGMGVLHVDTPSRDSFACDLMEAVRPQVDSYVLDWIMGQRLRREWFFEERNGNCRLMGSFAIKLSETAQTWADAVGPLSESISRIVWSKYGKTSRERMPATRLTQRSRSYVKGGSGPSEAKAPPPPRICPKCGNSVKGRTENCTLCNKEAARRHMLELAKLGRIATQLPKAQALRSATKRRHDVELKNWQPSDLPDWLTEETYRQKIQPRLAAVSVSKISAALGISGPYATDIRAGKRVPHPRHWAKLARLAGIQVDTASSP